MKTAFMGSDAIALPLLRYLKAERPGNIDLAVVYTQPDRRSGRGMQLRANGIKQWALQENLPVRQPVKCGQEEAGFLRSGAFDLILVMAYGQLLPPSVLDSPRLGALNLHASILPRLRGASPIHTAVALGLSQSGVSLMRMVSKLDAGAVADVETVPIEPDDTSPDLHAKLGNACIPLLRRCLPALATGECAFTEQRTDAVTYCRIIDKEDAFLDFYQPAAKLAHRIRAFTPWPGSSFPYDGTDLRIIEAEAQEAGPSRPPGFLEGTSAGSMRIACGSGFLRVLRLQRPGGKPMPTEDFLRGFPIPDGIVIGSRPMRALESSTPFPFKRKRNSSGTDA